MPPGPQTSCVVIGAGALGLGFLGPELAQDCRLTYLDVPAKGELLDHLHRHGRYVLNETGLAMKAVRVCGVDGMAVGGGGDAGAREFLAEADLVFTAIGEPNLPALVPVLAAVASGRAPDRPLRVLCSENGVEIARRLREAVEAEAGGDLGGSLRVGDTVMGRMCKVVGDPQPPLKPPAPGLDWAVVGEAFFGIPVEEGALEGLGRVPSALEPQSAARFGASEDVKMLSHNGLHAALACIGQMRGAEFLCDLRSDAELMALGLRLLVEEAGTALLRKHAGALGRNEYLNYADAILRRVTCPVLRDPVSRGMRGLMRKLEPWERLVYGLRTVAEQGVEPVAFATGLAAAAVAARRMGETDLDFRAVLTEHCGFDAHADAELIALIESRRSALERG
ncbi:MAG: mannitol dehydrogenase family protein [Planctomycetota bacterium]